MKKPCKEAGEEAYARENRHCIYNLQISLLFLPSLPLSLLFWMNDEWTHIINEYYYKPVRVSGRPVKKKDRFSGINWSERT